MTDIAHLTAAVVDLVGRRNLAQQEFQTWLAGPANGGPAGDGLYPLTDSTGFVRMVPSPAKQMSGGALPLQASVEALPGATKADVGTSLSLVGVAADGEVKKFTTDIFPARKTAGVDELHSEEWAEWLACFSSTGSERRMAVASVLRAVGNVIDPTHPPYNVVYDYQTAKPVKTTAGSNLVEAAEAVFSPADIGKLVAVSNGTNAGPLIGYIGQVLDAKRIYVFTDRGFGTPANAERTRGTEEMTWGTDCTEGLQAAFDAAEPASKYQRGKVVVIGGIAMARQLRFGSISIVGLGRTGCGFSVLPVANATAPFMADKNTGVYANLRIDAYTLRNISIYGARFTQYYSSFRRNLQIRGGNFDNFIRGAPYAVIDGLDLHDAQWEGGAFFGAYAGQFNNVRALFNAQTGIRIGFWDLNGVNWHAEGNGGAGVLSYMTGANVSMVRSSYNGTSGGTIFIGGAYWPHENGSNWTECGYGSTITNLRLQESWSHNLIISNRDPLGAVSNGSRHHFSLGTFDDTGNLVPGKKRGATRLPGVRAMVYIRGNTCVNSVITSVKGVGQVQSTNYATNAYWDEGNPSGNRVQIETPGISNNPADWFAGNGATAPGPWGTSSDSNIGSRNTVSVNGQLAP